MKALVFGLAQYLSKAVEVSKVKYRFLPLREAQFYTAGTHFHFDRIGSNGWPKSTHIFYICILKEVICLTEFISTDSRQVIFRKRKS